MPGILNAPKPLLMLAILAAASLSASAAGELFVDDAESRLLSALQATRNGNWQQAAHLNSSLRHDYPNFRAAAWLDSYIKSHQSPQLTDGSPIPGRLDEYTATNLAAEVQRRYQAAENRPILQTMPAPVLQISASTRHLLLVDQQMSRLYLIENREGKPIIIADYYAASGKQGSGKRTEGDHRTPIGVYMAADILAGADLDDLYGAGAIPLDYPNEWDRLLHRGGSGIWMHGVPADTYSRPPFSSRGCVTLSNGAFETTASHVVAGSTPVILAQHVEWIDEQTWLQRRKQLVSALHRWQQDWSQRDFEKYIAHYATDFRSGNMDIQRWRRSKRQSVNDAGHIEIELDNVAIYDYPGEEDLFLVDYRQHYKSDRYSDTSDKRQYWRREAGGWKIVYEVARKRSG